MVIPALLKVLDSTVYPIGEGILYKMIHQWYHYQKEEMLRKKKKIFVQIKEIIWWYENSHKKEIIYWIIYLTWLTSY